MSYKKTKGLLVCRVTKFTPYFMDAVLCKSKQPVTIFFKYKPIDKLANALKESVNNGYIRNFCVKERKGEPFFYDFIGVVPFRSNRAERIIAQEQLERTLNEDYNPVRSSKGQKLLTGRAGIPVQFRVGTKACRLASAVHGGIHDPEKINKKIDMEARKREAQRKSILRNLRKKFFYDREWMMLPIKNGGTDEQWDKFLWEHKDALSDKRSYECKSLMEELRLLGL